MNYFIFFLFFQIIKPSAINKDFLRIQEKFEIVERKFSRFYPYPFVRDRYRAFKEGSLKLKKQAQGDDTVRFNILAIRVAFQKEEPDDSLTTGNGWFDLKGKGNPDSIPFFSEPPHDRKYFETYLESLKAYLASVGYGKIKIDTYIVKPDKNDSFYILPHPMRYYGNPLYFEEGLVKLLVDAFHIADLDETIDFMDLNNNGIKDYKEGIKDVYIIFHAGSTWQTDIGDTPYDIATVTIPQGALEHYTGEKYILLNGGKDTVVSGIILPEQPSQDGMEVELQGLLFHEFPHDAFLATDLYGIYGRSAGVGAWCLMGTGGWNEVGSINLQGNVESVFGAIPSFPSAWMRLWFDNMALLMPQKYFVPDEWKKDTITPLWGFSIYKGMVDTINPLKNEISLKIYEATEPSSDTINYLPDSVRFPKIVFIPVDEYEYYLVEYRNDLLYGSFQLNAFFKNGTIISPYGAWDFLLPGSGLLIWHIDERTVIDHYWEINSYPPYKGVDLVEADGIQDLDKWTEFPETWYGSEYDPFFSGWKNSFSYNTFPSSKSKYGGNSFIEIYDIGERRKHSVTFKVKNGFLDLYIKDFIPDTIFASNVFFDVRDFDADGADEVVLLMSIFENYKGDTIPFKVDTAKYNSAFFIFDDNGNLLKSIYIKNVIKYPFTLSDIDGDGIYEVFYIKDGIFSLIKLNSNFDTLSFYNLPRFSSIPSIYDLNSDGIKEILICGEDYNVYALQGDNPSNILNSGFIGSKSYVPPGVSDNPEKIFVLGSDGVLRIFDYDLNKEKEIFNPYGGFSRIIPLCADFDNDGYKEIMGIRGNDFLFFYDLKDDKVRERILNDNITTSPSVCDLNKDGFLDFVFIARNKIYSFNYALALNNNFPYSIDDKFLQNIYISPISSEDILFLPFQKRIISYPFDEVYNINVSSFELKNFLITDNGKLWTVSKKGEIKVFDFKLSPFYKKWASNGERNLLFNLKSTPQLVKAPEKRVIIYPSVIKDKRGIIRFFSKNNTFLDVEFYTFSGHLVGKKRFFIDVKNTYKDINFDFSFLTPGPYILRWRTDDGEGTFKFYIVK